MTFDVFPPGFTNGASVEILRHCFTLAGAMKTPSLPWLLIRDARSLHHVRQYRRAVIDAGSAAEIAVKELIRANLPATLPPKLAEKLTEGQLGPALNTLKDSGYITTPRDFTTRLVRVRNNVVHMNADGAVSGAQSLDAIVVAAELVEAAEPLPPGLVREWL
ncbi:hypothetical protein [Nocardia nepalensis]|uniref:hypothetical protein n=1 Tax=Nocardia nepalensis TaxID=3375448 RepID=UPI003B682970